MTPQDIRELLDFVEEMAPRQEFGESEFKRWGRLLVGVPADYAAAEAAAIRVLQRKAFVEPHEVIEEIRLASARNLTDFVDPEPTTDEEAEYRRQLRANRRAIASGQLRPSPAELTGTARPELVALLRDIEGGGRGLARSSSHELMQVDAGPRASREASADARALAHGWTPEEVRLRDEAMAFPCPQCQAHPGQVCVNTIDGRPLTVAPAHRPRLEEAGLVEPQPRLTQEDYVRLLWEQMTPEERARYASQKTEGEPGSPAGG